MGGNACPNFECPTPSPSTKFWFHQVRACVKFGNSRKDQSVGKTFEVSVSKHGNFELFHSHGTISYGAYRYVASVQLPGGLVLGTLKNVCHG